MNEVSIKDLSVGQKVYVVDSDQRYGYQEAAIITFEKASNGTFKELRGRCNAN